MKVDLADTGRAIDHTANVARATHRRPRRHLGAEILVVLLSPIVLFKVLQVEPFSRQNGVDPFIYLGYAFDQTQLIHRYGLTYYSVRFGLILPIQFTTRLFGVTVGYFVLRYVLAILAGGAIYLFMRKLSGRGAALLGLMLFLTSPMLLRGLMTSYSDTTGVPYLTAAAALLLLSSLVDRRRMVWIAVASLLFALAIHSNPFNASLAAILVLAWAVSEALQRRAKLLIDFAVLGAGVLAVTIAGITYYELRFGTGNIIKPSLDAIRTYSGSAGEAFRAPTNGWLRYRFHLYLPPLVLGSWVITRVGRHRDVTRTELASMLMLAGTYLFFVAHEFVLGSSSFETYYYTSYLTGPLVISIAVLIDILLSGRSNRDRTLTIAAALVVALPLARNLLDKSFEFHWNPWIPLIFATAGAIMFGARANRRVVAAAVALLIVANAALLLGAPRNPPLATNQTFRYDPRYDLAIGNDDWSGLDWYRLTYDLSRTVPDLESPTGHVLFWFRDGSNLIDAMQSAFLWRATALMSTGPGMPYLDDWRIAHMRDEQVGSLVLLASNQADIATAIAALQQRSVQIISEDTRLLRRGHDDVWVDIVRVAAPNG